MGDLPDYTKQIVVSVDVEQPAQLEVIPRPKGGIKEKGSVTTASSYQTVAYRTVTSGKTFQPSRVIVSAEKAAYIQFYWDGTAISPAFLLDDYSVMPLHFPWGYHTMVGDGSKKFEVKAKYYASASTVSAEIVGEEVK